MSECRAGFSLIELVVVIGIVMILIGLMMPALGSAREQAVRTRNLAAIRGALVFLNLYTDANQDHYPIGWTDPVWAAMLWYLPLKQSGIIDSIQELGLVNQAEDRSLIALTQTAFIDQGAFNPGAGRDIYQESLVSQQSTRLRFPSQKGMLWQYLSEDSSMPDTEWCCLPDAPLAPVAFADGSAVLCTYRQFDVQPDPELYRHAGIPVVATWSGLAGRDVLVP